MSGNKIWKWRKTPEVPGNRQKWEVRQVFADVAAKEVLDS